jgi:hypothetical protein
LAAGARCPEDGGVATATTPEGPPATPPVLSGFTLGALLGSGGFGAVWEARPEDGGAPVAVKVSHATDPATARRLQREAEALGRVGPPHVPELRGHGTLPDGRAYLMMERLRGHTLADELAGWPARPEPERVRSLASALLASAAAIAGRGVLHRDLKPENVFLTDGQARLMDFGFALPLSSSDEHRTLTEAGAGTPSYMSPEQIAHRDPDLRSDVYALGAMLYELYTLRLPFTGDRRALEYAHLSFRPPPPSRFGAVPPAIERVILRCLAKDPAARFPDAAALALAFDRAAASAAAVPSGQTSAPQPAPAARAGDRQKVAFVFLQATGLSAMEVQRILDPHRGQIAHLAADRAACAFTHRAGENPAQRALAAAQTLLAHGLARRLVVDVGTVMVRPRPDGAPRILGAILTQPDRYPAAADPEGISLSAAARILLPGLAAEAGADRAPLVTHDRTQTTVKGASLPLFGREGELRRLAAGARRAVDERLPGVASVVAAAGLGKTHLAGALARRLADELPGARVIALAARALPGGDADETLAELLRRTLDLPSLAPPDGGRTVLAQQLGHDADDTFASAALALGWLSPQDPAVRAAAAAPGALRANLARAGRDALAGLARRQPVLLVLDDAHFADQALLDALEQVTVERLPLWICALGRPDFAQHRPGWGQRAAHRLALEVGPLDRESAAGLCRHLLLPAVRVPEPLIARLVERTQGLPLLLCDLVDGLKREGLLSRQMGGVWSVATEVLDRVPDSPSVEWLTNRELDTLPADLAAHARLLSLLAGEFSVEETAALLAAMDPTTSDGFPMDARVAVERLARVRLLSESRPGRWAFRTGVMREAVAQTVPAPLALAIHRAALAYYRGADWPSPRACPGWPGTRPGRASGGRPRRPTWPWRRRRGNGTTTWRRTSCTPGRSIRWIRVSPTGCGR